MKFLIDHNLSGLLADELTTAGYEAVHVATIGMATASDTEIMQVAADAGYVVVSGDTDFGQLLARSNATLPSVILIRRQRSRRAADLASLLLLNFDAIEDSLTVGAVVVFDDSRLRIRPLPFRSID